MSEFKVGQEVLLVQKNDSGLDAQIGDVGKVSEITDDCEYPINVTWLRNGKQEAVHPSELKLIEEENK